MLASNPPLFTQALPWQIQTGTNPGGTEAPGLSPLTLGLSPSGSHASGGEGATALARACTARKARMGQSWQLASSALEQEPTSG